jgi:hypothetical protein
MDSPTARSRPTPAGGVARGHRVLSLLFLAGALVQFFLAGLGAFGGTSYEAHRTWGTVLTVIALVVLVLAFAGRREAVQASLVLFVLMIVQNVLGAVGTDVPVLGALHPVVGLAVLGAAMTAAAGSRVRFGPPHSTA